MSNAILAPDVAVKNVSIDPSGSSVVNDVVVVSGIENTAVQNQKVNEPVVKRIWNLHDQNVETGSIGKPEVLEGIRRPEGVIHRVDPEAFPIVVSTATEVVSDRTEFGEMCYKDVCDKNKHDNAVAHEVIEMFKSTLKDSKLSQRPEFVKGSQDCIPETARIKVCSIGLQGAACKLRQQAAVVQHRFGVRRPVVQEIASSPASTCSQVSTPVLTSMNPDHIDFDYFQVRELPLDEKVESDICDAVQRTLKVQSTPTVVGQGDHENLGGNFEFEPMQVLNVSSEVHGSDNQNFSLVQSLPIEPMTVGVDDAEVQLSQPQVENVCQLHESSQSQKVGTVRKWQELPQWCKKKQCELLLKYGPKWKPGGGNTPWPNESDFEKPVGYLSLKHQLTDQERAELAEINFDRKNDLYRERIQAEIAYQQAVQEIAQFEEESAQKTVECSDLNVVPASTDLEL